MDEDALHERPIQDDLSSMADETPEKGAPGRLVSGRVYCGFEAAAVAFETYSIISRIRRVSIP